ncbi:MAG: hypothetical protein H8E34_13955 [Bacteroidetes bacterium]|nr:hypothetical protein [Bacteroidota bacterium]
MNKIPKYLTLFLAFAYLSFSNITAQQPDSLARNSEELFRQISEIMLATPSKVYQEKSEVLLARFYERWSIGRFNADEKAEVRYFIENMRSKKMRTYPYLYDYLYALTLIAESQQLPKSIIVWHAYATKLINEDNSIHFSNFLDFTVDLFEKDRIHRKNTLSWYNRNSRYSFVLDTNFLVVFQKGDLVCATKNDSSIINDTKGTFNYELKRWDGERGKLNWSRFGVKEANQIYADFNKYSINLTLPAYTIDSVTLHYNRFFNQPIIGKISERISSSPPTEKTSFPRFEAYFDEFELYNIYPEVSFFGGAQLEGLTLYGTGGVRSKAIVKLTKSDSLYAIIRAEKFRLDATGFISANAEFVFYFDQDSLYHPSLRVNYTNDNRQFVMYTDHNASAMTPFFDSYHELDIYVQALFWRMNESELVFKRIRNIRNRNIAHFVSSNYFSQRDFYRLEGIDDINPLYVIENYINIYGESEITLNALASYMEKPADQVSAMLIDLSNRGFLLYDSRKKRAIVKDRFKYFLYAKSGHIDYDIIKLTSNVEGKPNAIINLNTLDLVVLGVPEVSISDSQEVYIYPYDKTISFKKNRNFTFDGRVQIGLLDFYSRNSTFVYDSFMLKMNYVDSLAFKVYSNNSIKKNDSLVKIKNVIVDIVGSIYIDHPDNKSGLKKFEEFPKFVSNDVSYVYYNKKSIQDSTLIPESFYYAIDPFIFDSISTFTTEGLSFEGNLTSSSIFPTIDEPLVVMPDYSLGFNHITHDSGYNIYGDLGKFSSNISISNRGFMGDGNLHYLSSYSSSDNYTFYSDSLTGISNDFRVVKSPEEYNFPSAQCDTVNIHWAINTNIMTLTSEAGPFRVYDNSWLAGTMFLNPDFMRGEGSFIFDQSEIVSNDINFKYITLTADTADFFLKNSLNDSLVFDVREYFAKIDFDNQLGWFTNLNDNSFIGFPFNNFISTLDEVEWIMNDDKLLLSSNLKDDYEGLNTLNRVQLIDYKLRGPEFISINKEQDSLRFFAGNATYNLNDYTIDVEKVKLIKVGDAAIFPVDETVRILRGARIKTLTDALIIADTATTYHSIYDAEVNIYGTKQFTAKGWIDYSDINGMKQPIFLSSISANADGVTTGFGEIPEGEIFFISPEYNFEGEVSLLASRRDLRFNGAYKINEECIANVNNGVAFNQVLNPKQIYFNINNSTQDADGRIAFFGLAYSDAHRKFYPLALEPLNNSNDLVFINSTGQLRFDAIKNAFSVGAAERFSKNNMQSNFVTFDNSRCVMRGDGNFNLGLDINMLTIKSSGTFEHFIVADSTYINTVLLLDFYFDEPAIEMMTDSIRLSKNEGVNTSEGIFPMFLQKNLPHDEAEKNISELVLYGQMRKMPDQIAHKIIFSNLNLYWDLHTRSYVSTGKIGIGYLGGNVINKYVDGWVQIEKGRSGSSISIYLEPSEKTWYFLNYKNGIMQVISSDNAFNERIETINPEKRILNPDSDTDYYEYVISTRRKSVEFVRKMKNF